jgi:tRNA (mo5U34)-methyltransferase
MAMSTANPSSSRDERAKRVNALRWMHSIDLGGGLTTPGAWGPPQPLILRAFGDIDFRGKKVLDIGCWDGLWSFEAEKRGAAEVYATDLTRHRVQREQPTFQLAHELLGSKARYVPDLGVYDIRRLGVSDFDIVLFLGVIYHLKHPLLALSRLRQVMSDGAIIVVESETLPTEENVAQFYYREPYKQDHSNWWIPSLRVLREWVECSYFRLKREYTPGVGPGTRHLLVANAVRDADPRYVFPDDELSAFDGNHYD